MDLSAFSNENFIAKDWINSTFQLPEAQENKEAYAATLVLKLQSFIQEVNNALEKTAEQVIQNIPRIIREVDSMKQEAQLLQDQMKSVKAEVMKVEQDSTKSMQTLLEIDKIKSRMQEGSKALREADNWTTLSADVEEVFHSGDINAISAKLVGMQNSLEILVDVPDYKDRCQRLESLKDRLEAMLSPQLVSAFNVQSLDVAQVYIKIFRDIKRLSQLQKYYHKCQKAQLLQQWHQIVESDPEESLADWMNSFYDMLLSTWHSQMSWCSQVFIDIPATDIIAELIVDVLSSMEPSLPFCIEAALKQQENPLLYLIEIKQITDRFAKSLDVAIRSVGHDHLQRAHVILLAQTLYSPYRIHIEKYSILEEKIMLSYLKSLNLYSEDLMDGVRMLGESVSKIFYCFQEAERRCHQLTNGCGYPSLLKALRALFNSFVDEFRSVIRQLRQANKQRDKGLTDDWTLFQQALHTMQITGEVVLYLDRLEKVLFTHLQEVERKLENNSTGGGDERQSLDPFHAYDITLLSPLLKKDLKEMMSRLQDESKSHFLFESKAVFKRLCVEVGRVVTDIVFYQVQNHLQELPGIKVWTLETPGGALTPDLPTFSISPQEYITQIGQYLMTLPQHIEPFILQDNPALYTAFKYAQLPYEPTQDALEHLPDYLLECLAQGITEKYTEAVLRIPHVTPHAANQLATDIGYLCDILDDLGMSPSSKLQDLVALLNAKPETFESVAQNKPGYLVTAVKNMRGI